MSEQDSGALFISYTHTDRRWAEWIAWELEAVGFTTMLQDWDFGAGTNFILEMDRAARTTTRTIAVLSPAYLASLYTQPEWAAAVARDPTGESRTLIPVRVEPCRLTGLLAQRVYVDLVGKDETASLQAVLDALGEHRLKPTVRPPFPPGRRHDACPVFPGITAPIFRAPPRNPIFTGRDQLLVDLDAALTSDIPTALVQAITGLGGAGKTQVAIEYSYRHHNDYRLVWWVRAETPEILREDLAALAAPLGLSVSTDAPPAEVAAAVHRKLQSTSDWLLIFDNAESLAAVRDYLPDRGHVLVTSRNPAWHARATVLQVDVWSPQEAVAFLLRRTGRSDASGGGALAEALGYLPLALEQAGAYMDVNGTSFVRYLDLYRDRGGATLLAQHGPHDYAGTVATTWSLSFDRARETLPAAAELLELCALLAPEAIPENLFHPADRSILPPSLSKATGNAFDTACGVLRRYSLVQRSSGSLTLHRLVQGVVRDALPAQRLRKLATSGVLLLRAAFPENSEDVRNWERCAQLMPHALAVAGHAERIGIEPAALSWLLDRMATYLRTRVELGRIRPPSEKLIDLSNYVTQQTMRLSSDQRYRQELYVPQRFRDLDRLDGSTREDVAEEVMQMVSAEHGCFALVLGEFGSGKTFLLRELARRIAEQLPHIVPILIDLRALDKAYSVDGLVAAHLAHHGEQRIDLSAFHDMLHRGLIALLFDGFDELVTRVTYERATEHFETLLRAAEGDAKIVVASRTQHFQSLAQVLTALGGRVDLLPNRRLLTVENFNRTQIHAYLVNRYKGSVEDADRRLQLISGIQDLLGLSQNPRMLSFIADMEEQRLRSAAVMSAAALYQEILASWLEYESVRAQGVQGAPPSLPLDDMRQAVTTLALRLWETGEPYLRLAHLTEVADTLTGLAAVRSARDQTTYQVGSSSLLVRTEEGMFGFIHSSVAEWLVAHAIAQRLPEDPPELGRRPLSPLIIDFLCHLATPQACQAWIDRVLTSPAYDSIARVNALRISTRLRTPPTASLRHVSLQGEDLSHRELQGVDLTGADLTDARLVNTNLSGAILREARLVGARLDEAKLTGADMTGADLTLARFACADLRGVTVTGSRWNRASLINVTGMPNAPELRGAAVVPGQEVKTECAPAEIGVRHGFHHDKGRLPQPLAYSGDGGTIAIGSEHGGVLVCDTSTGQPLRTLQGHRGRVFAVAYGSDDRVLVTGGSDGAVRIWDPATGDCLQTLTGQREWAWPIAISPSGDVVAAGDADGLLWLWSTLTGSLLSTVADEHGFIYTAAFHPNGEVLVTGCCGGAVHFWEVDGGESRFVLEGELTSIYRVAFNPPGTLLAGGTYSGAVRIWDPRDGSLRQDLTGHTASVYTLAFHPRAALLASGATDGSVRLWDTDAGQCRAVLTGHTAAIYWVTFSPLGDVLATGDSAGTVRLWDVATTGLQHVLTEHTGCVWPFEFRGDGRQLAISDDQFTTRLWNPMTGRSQHVLTGHGRRVTSVSLSADGEALATTGNDGVVRLWNPATGELRRTLVGTDDRLVTLETAVFSPEGSVLATVSSDGRVNLISVRTERYERHLNVEPPPIWALTFSPSGEYLATANDDDTVRLWLRTNGRLLHILGEHRGRVRSIAFHPSGSTLVTGCDDRKVRLWSVDNGELLSVVEGHEDRVYAVSFSADGTLLASASWDGTARIWSAAGSPLHVMRGHVGRLWTTAFSPRGSILATAGDDLVVRLWEASSGQHLHTLTGHTRGVWSLSFSPGGSMLASGGDDGATLLWSLGGSPSLRLTLLGLPEGWAALAPDGRYKLSGNVAGQFWHVIGMCRFDTAYLERYLSAVRQLPPGTAF